MLDTVDWSGDGDDADFFQAIERIFDIRLRSHLPWTTFGEVREHVVAHVAASGQWLRGARAPQLCRARRSRGPV